MPPRWFVVAALPTVASLLSPGAPAARRQALRPAGTVGRPAGTVGRHATLRPAGTVRRHAAPVATEDEAEAPLRAESLCLQRRRVSPGRRGPRRDATAAPGARGSRRRRAPPPQAKEQLRQRVKGLLENVPSQLSGGAEMPRSTAALEAACRRRAALVLTLQK